MMTVSPQVHTLVNHGTIQNNYYFALAKPLERDGVKSVKTFIPDDPATTVETTKEDSAALRAFSLKAAEDAAEEVIENVTTKFLHPKAGTYGETSGTWTFRKAGTKRTIRAKILDEEFLEKFEKGTIRFYREDMLKVRLREVQTVKGARAVVENEIIEVHEYRKGSPVVRKL